jgi:two-component system, OmpR family, sensor histidine kinase MtrB
LSTTREATSRWRGIVIGLLGRLLRGIRYRWLRSIQARVVISTVVLSALVISLAGWMLARQVMDGLVDNKREESISQAQSGVHFAQEQLGAQPLSGEIDEGVFLTQLVTSLSRPGGGAGNFEVILVGPLTPQTRCDDGRTNVRRSAVSCDSVPQALLAEVIAQASGLEWTYTTMRRANGAEDPAIVVGSTIRLASAGDSYALMYLFPMDDEVETLSVFKRGMVSAGVILVVLVAGVAWVVTRQVVTPIRLARRIAERLAAGRLEERMHVRGRDDIARLGVSFNQMAASLQRQIRQLEELSRMQRRFVSDVSHELRTPLTTVRMAADVLYEARSDFDPATARAAELLQTELDRFESLLTDLLEISRFDAGAARLELDTIDLADIAERAVASYGTLAERHGTGLRLDVDGRPALVEGDARRIERIVRNLVTNAIQYSQSPDVVLKVRSDEQAVALTVRDRGVGLFPGESTLVFNRFWRADPARARAGGTGLGLAIALEDAQLHGGWLQAWGEPDQGAQFRLTLPRYAGDDLRRSPLPLVPRDDTGPQVGQAYERLDRLDVGAGEP